MRKRSTPIGEILVSLGRISHEDVERALAYQREWGGYFGDALVALDLATPAEVKWGLADQYDLPFVNLHADGIDRTVAAQVPAGWAREHLVLPVLRDGGTVTVVLSDPRDLGRLIEVQQFTGAATVEAALSTPSIIRTLIEAVHGEPDATPVPVLRFLVEALESGAEELGISVRAGRATGWSRRNAVVHRVLEGDPLPELRRLVSPFPEPGAGDAEGVRSWAARIALPGLAWTAECHALGDGAALEWAARITGAEAEHSPAAWLEPELHDEVARALLRGAVLVQVTGAEGGELLRRALPALPALLLDREPRAVHLSDREGGEDGGGIALDVGESLRQSLGALQPFALEALTLDVADASDLDLQTARRAARLVVAHLRSGEPASVADFRVALRRDGDALSWTRAASAHAAD